MTIDMGGRWHAAQDARATKRSSRTGETHEEALQAEREGKPDPTSDEQAVLKARGAR